MIANPFLSITIPTYNRSDFLDYCLEIHIPLVRKFNIQIFISDNASTDSTKQVVEKWQQKYSLLYYYKNETNLGELNFEIALKYPNTKFVWLLGDTAIFPAKSLIEIIKQLNLDYDMIIVNSNARVTNVSEMIIRDKNALLKNLGWHMTQIASLIYNKKIIEQALFDRYYDTNFIQTGIIFETLAKQKNIFVLWLQECYTHEIQLPGIRKTSWRPYTFDIWIVRWSNFILSLPPQYTLENKLFAIQQHNNKTKLFKLKNLLTLRSDGYYNYKIFSTYKSIFSIALKNYSIFVLFIISILPSFPLNIMINIIKKLKKYDT
ncbi:MAG: glycosyltransferase family 2 protein [Sulfuricurvum sp.]|uniref:glycosyltransferase family 2 protein n=1 Tax=Sulfuricurvum sp. TaxID=2025608 RepID=UPI00260A6D47|nr:glycosyltransferase family 2 protein [Sulfuricurvum sp.]MDD2828058.1 glycosyltransferase family 2 protein [Sulfuricurvum sp.]MDD4948065.1 glycosyltransferase family 2 protein [Sulfuricurvum sp.]